MRLCGHCKWFEREDKNGFGQCGVEIPVWAEDAKRPYQVHSSAPQATECYTFSAEPMIDRQWKTICHFWSLTNGGMWITASQIAGIAFWSLSADDRTAIGLDGNARSQATMVGRRLREDVEGYVILRKNSGNSTLYDIRRKI